jgi:alkylation response protein AidB-like acyl-CoA dehydrogenase
MVLAASEAGAAMIEVARGLAGAIYAARDQTERDRQLPAALVARMADAGLFRMLVPREFGGAELDLASYVRVVEEIARVDGSAGWCVMICSNSAVASGYIAPSAAREIFGSDPRVIVGGSFGPRGRAVATDGGYRLSGGWTMASGSSHCTWFTAGATVYDGDRPRRRADGTPETLVAFVPRREVRVLDTWYVGGLRGTASNDWEVAGAFVPAERTFVIRGRSVQPGPLYAFPLVSLLACSVASVTLGIARGAIDALIDLAKAKIPLTSQDLLRERATVQDQVGRAEALLQGGRAFLFQEIDAAWQDVLAGREVGPDQRARLRLAAVHAATSAAQAVALMYTAGGATAIYASSSLERAFRDVHTATHHFLIQEQHYATIGSLLLGLDLPGGRQI